jgi:hypothetical protein
MADENESSSPGIDWGEFRTDFVKLGMGVQKKLKLTNWRTEHRFERPGLRFDVLEEDSVSVDKTFSITSRRLIRALRPIIQKAERGQDDIIHVSILRTGKGLDTAYEVREDA